MLSNSFSNGWIGLSPIETLIQRACEPSLGEPPYNLHIELAEYINNKKANTPREAAHAVLRLVNSRNPHVALLALSLLNTLVAQCGYPFHLQISTKEFLNELVKRFPERPPPYPGPVMSRILELINEWKESIATDGRWKDDFGNIRDMWRLLMFKGYRFKERRRPTEAEASTSQLKSAEELENEDRVAQEAKLQELIRRGTPRDLAIAQDLMKVLAGASPDSKPDYKKQVLTELGKLESKVVLMTELLDHANENEKFVKGDVYDQVSGILVQARPKIQKWIEQAQGGTEEGLEGDPESLDTYLQINDQINSVLTRYDAYKKGDFSMSSVPPELAPSSSSAAPAKSELIDLMDFGASESVPPSGISSSTTANDLMGLFSSPSSESQAQPTTSPSPFQNQNQGSKSIDLNMLYSQGGIQLPRTPVPTSTPQPQIPSMAGTFWPTAVGGSNGNGSAGVGSTNMTVTTGTSQQQQQHQSQQQSKDPFSDLANLF